MQYLSMACRRHWSDYGQTYNIQKTAIQASWLFLFYLQFPRSLRHSFLLMKRDPADQHETTIWRNQTDTVTWLAVSVSLPTLLGYQRASAFVNATKLASQPLFSSDEEYKISNVLSNKFFIDIAHVSIAIHIVIVLSPSPMLTYVWLFCLSWIFDSIWSSFAHDL